MCAWLLVRHYMYVFDNISVIFYYLRVVEVVSAVTSLTLFLQFTVAAMILCVCMLNALIFADRAGQIMTVGYYMGVLLQTGGACFQASMLEAECVKLPLAIFHCQWLNLDRRSRSLLTFFMQRAQVNVCFTAIKLFQINLRTNLSVSLNEILTVMCAR